MLISMASFVDVVPSGMAPNSSVELVKPRMGIAVAIPLSDNEVFSFGEQDETISELKTEMTTAQKRDLQSRFRPNICFTQSVIITSVCK